MQIKVAFSILARFKHIVLLIMAAIAMMSQASTYESLTFVMTDGSKVTFAVEGLKITYDDYVHAVVSNERTSATLNLAELKCMYFSNREDYPTGDVNADGEVNIADVNALIDIILGSETDETTAERADVNNDGEVNVADVNTLIDIILG